MSEADLARTDAQAAADECGQRRRMVRRAERPRADEPPALERPRDRGDHRHLERLRRGQVGQYAGQAGGHQRLARPRRPRHQQVVAARSRDFERALRSEEHTSELQSLMRISYAVFCLTIKTITTTDTT